MNIVIYSNNTYLVQGLQHLLAKTLRLTAVHGGETFQSSMRNTTEAQATTCKIIDLTGCKDVIRKINQQAVKTERNIFIVSDACYEFMRRLFVMEGIYILPLSARLSQINGMMREIKMSCATQFSPLSPTIAITLSERRLLWMLCTESEPLRIARALSCNVKTVYTHKHNTIRKLKLRSRLELYRFLFCGAARPYCEY